MFKRTKARKRKEKWNGEGQPGIQQRPHEIGCASYLRAPTTTPHRRPAEDSQPTSRRTGERSLPRRVDNSHAPSLFPSPLSLALFAPSCRLSPRFLAHLALLSPFIIFFCFPSRFKVFIPLLLPLPLGPRSRALHALLSPWRFVFFSFSLFLSVSPVPFLSPLFLLSLVYLYLPPFSCILSPLSISSVSPRLSLFSICLHFSYPFF